MRTSFTIGAVTLALAHAVHAAPAESVLYSFTGANGDQPIALVADGKGNFYGTTRYGGKTVSACPNYIPPGSVQPGGPPGCGIVFKLSPPASGKKAWTRTVVHNFTNRDGSNPVGNLILDKAGNLYGATSTGGAGSKACPPNFAKGIFAGCGVIFKLTPPTAGKILWTETVLHSFTGTDGASPSGIAINTAGMIFGNTFRGGKSSAACPAVSANGTLAGCGTTFRLTPPAKGKTAWTETVLHDFGSGQDGLQPASAPLISGGKLFGVADAGGTENAACPAQPKANFPAGGCGIVYELAPSVGQTAWTETVIWRFAGGSDGSLPYAGLIADAGGNLYGTTLGGGTGGKTNQGTTGNGLVFELSPPAAGKMKWIKTNLHVFAAGADGATPYGTLLKDAAGNIYGTTGYGGSGNLGTAFELTPPAKGKTAWTETVLHGFGPTSVSGDGLIPLAGLVRDAHGALYGTTASSGSFGKTGFTPGSGTVFKITP